MPQHHVSSLTSLLGRQRLHTCITAPRCGASGFKPSIDTIPFVCLAARRVAAMERAVSTAGYVKLLLPPRGGGGNACLVWGGKAGGWSRPGVFFFPAREGGWQWGRKRRGRGRKAG